VTPCGGAREPGTCHGCLITRSNLVLIDLSAVSPFYIARFCLGLALSRPPLHTSRSLPISPNPRRLASTPRRKWTCRRSINLMGTLRPTRCSYGDHHRRCPLGWRENEGLCNRWLSAAAGHHPRRGFTPPPSRESYTNGRCPGARAATRRTPMMPSRSRLNEQTEEQG
jgi:hypothetical protein